jgi:hypothetical protein
MKRTAIMPAVNFLLALMLAAASEPAHGAQSGGGQASKEATAVAAVGSITGRVVGEGGEPLSQVTVSLMGRAAGIGVQRTTVSDDEGSFAFDGLAPGVYNVYATSPGYYGEVAGQGGAPATSLRPGDTVTIRLNKGGVITGTVTDQNGDPIVAMSVNAYLVRGPGGQSPQGSAYFSSFGQTDDRGVYRIYGLMSGVYVVAAGGPAPVPFSPYTDESPTFFPSSTRDTAAEVNVRAGQETQGIDIRYREERGQRVSGVVEFPADLAGGLTGVSVVLLHAATGSAVVSGFVAPRDDERRFQFSGVPDGDYEVRAVMMPPDAPARTSEPRRVTVRGADVTGLSLKLAPLASVSGRVVIEPPVAPLPASELCRANAPSPRLLAAEVTLTARREEEARAGTTQRPGQYTRAATSPDETGAFTLLNLEAGRYHLYARPLDESLFVRSVQLPAAAPAAPVKNTPRPHAVALKSGQSLSGVVFRIAYGAAFIAGRLVASETTGRVEDATEAGSRPRVYLVPAEAERGDDLLGYFEMNPTADGSFLFRNVAPGRYLLVVRAAPAFAPGTIETPLFWTAEGRAALRREAEAARPAFDLQPCQRLTDIALPFPPPAAPRN